MMDLEKISGIRRRLKHAWGPFFSRFGRLLPIQVETIPKILDGANVVVASPTASGKTEAVVAPVAERFIREQWQGLAVLYVVPTRALANDTLARIEGPLGDMGIKTALKHGDKPYLPSDNLPNLLITTPESLDSLICRRSRIFGTLRTVILDEIHLLDNTYRGDQLRLLLWRLQELATENTLSVHLLSATLAFPHYVAERYVRNFEVVKVSGQRDIDYRLLSSLEEVVCLARREGRKKIICFCNLRESCEQIAPELTKLWHPYPVVVHHGSLDRQVREEAEEVMKEADVAMCVATSTLEVGIDIGDVDLVVLVEPPWSVSSLLQRIGRGNRREDVIRVVAIFKSAEEKALLKEMFKIAASGALPEEPYVPDPSVAIQQTFSLLYQNSQGMPEPVLLKFISPLCSQNDGKLILQHLQRNEWIERTAEGWRATTRLMDLGEKGWIHSNIPDSQTYVVKDVASGKEIGRISGVFDEVFVLAGKIWRVVSVEDDTIKVRPFQGENLQHALFHRHRNKGAFHWLLPKDLKPKPEK
jgi:ATP-dependent Lhr-like helicase